MIMEIQEQIWTSMCFNSYVHYDDVSIMQFYFLWYNEFTLCIGTFTLNKDLS